MPRKIRGVLAELARAGFVNRGGKGSHRNCTHLKGGRVTVAGRPGDGAPLPPPTAGREYSGKFMLRLTPELHETLAARALAAGDSLNQYTARLLTAAASPSAAPRRGPAKGRRLAAPA